MSLSTECAAVLLSFRYPSIRECDPNFNRSSHWKVIECAQLFPWSAFFSHREPVWKTGKFGTDPLKKEQGPRNFACFCDRYTHKPYAYKPVFFFFGGGGV